MRCPAIWLVSALLVVGSLACKDPETAARQAKQKTASEKTDEGRRLLAAADLAGAAGVLQEAINAAPGDPTLYLLIAEAHRQAGNDAAAILALKRADELSRGADPSVQKQLAELYRRSGYPKEAIAVLGTLRSSGQLQDPELLMLSRLHMQQGDTDAAFSVLEDIQRRNPDDPAAKVVEAEILLARGEEQLAATLMDRLVSESAIPSAWVLRARYFLNNGHPELAESDLARLTDEAAESPEAIELKARVLNALKRHDEAEAALRGLLARSPRDPDVLAQLAETTLHQGRAADAEALIGQALALRPRFPRALYVRARALEAQGELGRAAENYAAVVQSDPSFAPALSRIWRLHVHRGERTEAMGALERLLFMGEASLDEKVALAELYADTGLQVERGKRLIDDALRHDPQNPRYRELRNRLAKAGSSLRRTKGPVILRGGR